MTEPAVAATDYDFKGKCIVLYVGTRKLVAMFGDMRENHPRVLRYEEIIFPDGFEKGLVCNLQNATATLEKVIGALLPEEFWERVPFYVVLGNRLLKMHRFSSCEYYDSEKRMISNQEVSAVIQQTKNVATLPLTEFVLQAVPETFLVNDMPLVRNPIGLEAERLGVTLQIYTMDFQGFRNLSRIFEALDIRVHGYFPKTLTLSEAVLNETEKQEGVMIIDIADDATQVILWNNGFLVGTRILETGGHELTQCLARDWNIDERDAERVKEKFGTLDLREQESEELIPLVSRNEKVQQSLPRKEFLNKFFHHARSWMNRILSGANQFLQEEKIRHPHTIFTGGGVLFDGFLEWTQKEFSLEGKVGVTRQVEAPQELIRDPSLAPALGMFRWIAVYKHDYEPLFTPKSVIRKTVMAARQWFSNYF